MLYLMRHGKTDWNAQRKMQGHTDIPLNEEGRKMAVDAREKYKDISFDLCFCSPLIRARETAELFLTGRDIPIIPDDRLMEMGFGEYEGCAWVIRDHIEPICQVFEDPEHYVPSKSAESFDDLFARTGDFLKKVADPLTAEGKNVLIVGHGAMNTSILCQKLISR